MNNPVESGSHRDPLMGRVATTEPSIRASTSVFDDWYATYRPSGENAALVGRFKAERFTPAGRPLADGVVVDAAIDADGTVVPAEG